MRRRMIKELDDMGLKYKTGEFVGDGLNSVTIEHGLEEVPFIFAFIGEKGEETSGTLAAVMMNTGMTTNYTSAVTKEWLETAIRATETDSVSMTQPSSVTYGVQSVDENAIYIKQCANKQNFISGKTYHWIAIADWRS